jgi:hypothetical protein
MPDGRAGQLAVGACGHQLSLLPLLVAAVELRPELLLLLLLLLLPPPVGQAKGQEDLWGDSQVRPQGKETVDDCPVNYFKHVMICYSMSLPWYALFQTYFGLQ